MRQRLMALLSFFLPKIPTLLSSLSFKKQEQSPKCMSISTDGNVLRNYTYSPNNLLISAAAVNCDYGSSIADDDIHAVSCPVLPSVVQERSCSQKRRRISTKENTDDFLSPVNPPKPYQEFLDEVRKHKHWMELDTPTEAAYTTLLNKLKKKEVAIDCWESSQRSKAELELDTTKVSTLLASLSFNKKEQSPKCMSISTAYESAIDQGFNVGGGERNGNVPQHYTYSPDNLLISSGSFTII